MSFADETVGILIFFSGSTNSPPVRLGYFDGTSINYILTAASVPLSLTPYYIGSSKSNLPYIFANSNTGETKLYSFDEENGGNY
jgi:hypothetical protein